jgi:hypothetical protein
LVQASAAGPEAGSGLLGRQTKSKSCFLQLRNQQTANSKQLFTMKRSTHITHGLWYNDTRVGGSYPLRPLHETNFQQW